ncbi:MAG: hypothetical protein NVS1B9_00350 [Solirubrobacteraceae bacterium]
MQDAPIEEIAKAVGLARGLIYRQFASKEELYVLTVTVYLDELAELLQATIALESEPPRQLRRAAEIYCGYCARYPAFLDCSLSLMQRPARGLYTSISEAVWLRLGVSMTACIEQLNALLHRGVASGDFSLADPDFTANLLWTQVLGAMHLARIRIGMRRAAESGEPDIFTITPQQVLDGCVASALATVGCLPERSPG